MPYNFLEISDHDLKLFFAVINDLSHKSSLMDATGPLKFSTAPIGVSSDEQIAILHRLASDCYISFSNDRQSVWLSEDVDRSFSSVYSSVHEAYHKRFDQAKAEKNLQPHYDGVNGVLYLQGYEIKIKKHDEDTKQNQLLKYIFITNSKDLTK